MLHSSLQLTANEVALSKEASSSGSSTFGSDKYNQNPSSSESESSSSLCSASSGRGVSAVFSGGHRHARSGRGRGGSRGPHPPCPWYADLSDEYLSSVVGSNFSSSCSAPKQSSGENYRPRGSLSSSSESSGLLSPLDTSLAVAHNSQVGDSFEDPNSDEELWGEQALPRKADLGSLEGAISIDVPDKATRAGLWPGQKSTPLLSCFVALHFWGDWQAYIQFEMWANARMWSDPDGSIHIDEWHASLLDDGGGKLAAVAGRGQEKAGEGNRESGWNEEKGNKGSVWNVDDGKDLSVFNLKCNKTPPCIDSYSAVANTGSLLGTPPLTRQLFLRESNHATVGEMSPEKAKEISWSLMASDTAPDARSNEPPFLKSWGTPIKALSKQGKLITQLAAAEWVSAAANARINALRLVPAPTEEELLTANLLCSQVSGHLPTKPWTAMQYLTLLDQTSFWGLVVQAPCCQIWPHWGVISSSQSWPPSSQMVPHHSWLRAPCWLPLPQHQPIPLLMHPSIHPSLMDISPSTTAPWRRRGICSPWIAGSHLVLLVTSGSCHLALTGWQTRILRVQCWQECHLLWRPFP